MDRLRQLAEVVHVFQASEQKLSKGISLPGKDVPILLAAIEARATHLLTGDIRHFGPYLGKKIAGIVICLPGDYLKQKAGRESQKFAYPTATPSAPSRPSLSQTPSPLRTPHPHDAQFPSPDPSSARAQSASP